MGKITQKAQAVYSFMADTLQIVGFFGLAASGCITALLVVIGWLEQVPYFVLALFVPLCYVGTAWAHTRWFRHSPAVHKTSSDREAESKIQGVTHNWVAPSLALREFIDQAFVLDMENRRVSAQDAARKVSDLESNSPAPSIRVRDPLAFGLEIDREQNRRMAEHVAALASARMALDNSRISFQESYDRAVNELRRRLEVGDLIANGFDEDDGTLVEIRAEFWRFLQLQVTAARAEGAGRMFHSIRIAQRSEDEGSR